MKWSAYDLALREWCIKNKKPIPGKPEAEYKVNWNTPVYQDAANHHEQGFKLWGKNKQVDIKFNDYKSNEEYWQAVRDNAAKNLDKLVEDRNRH